MAVPTDTAEMIVPAGGWAGASGQARTWAAALCWLVAAMIVGSRVLSLAANPSPWADEAMISLNLRLVPWRDILRPLPLFDQTAPLGFVLIGKAVGDLAGTHFILAMRVTAAIASLAAAGLYFRALAAARPRFEAALTVGLLMLSPAFVYYGIEIKHYVYEALASVLVLAAGVNALRADADLRSMAVFTLASAAALVLAFPAVLVIAGFGSALFLFLALDPQRSPRKLAVVAGAGLLLAAIQAGIYVGYSGASVALQLEAYAGKYATGHLVFPPLNRSDLAGWGNIVWLLEKHYVSVPPRWLTPLFAAIAAIGWLRGLLSPSRMTRYLFVAATISIAATLAAACLGVFTPKAQRHLLFLAPMIAPALVLGLATILEWASGLAPRPLRAPEVALSLLVLLYGARGLAASPQAEREPVRRMLERVQHEGGWPDQTWVYYMGQSSIDLLTYPQAAPYLGRIPFTSSPKTWFHHVRGEYGAYLARFTRETAGRPRIYILYSHTDPGRMKAFLANAERAVGPCSLVDQGRGNRGMAGLYLCVRPARPANPKVAPGPA